MIAELTTVFTLPTACELPDRLPEAIDLCALILYQQTPCCATCGSSSATLYDGGAFCDGCRRRVVSGLGAM